MILFDLKCNNGHQFEAWFPSSSKYEDQVKKNLVSCPFCDSKKIEKSLMAPNLNLANANKKKKNYETINKKKKAIRKRSFEI